MSPKAISLDRLILCLGRPLTEVMSWLEISTIEELSKSIQVFRAAFRAQMHRVVTRPGIDRTVISDLPDLLRLFAPGPIAQRIQELYLEPSSPVRDEIYYRAWSALFGDDLEPFRTEGSEPPRISERPYLKEPKKTRTVPSRMLGDRIDERGVITSICRCGTYFTIQQLVRAFGKTAHEGARQLRISYLFLKVVFQGFGFRVWPSQIRMIRHLQTIIALPPSEQIDDLFARTYHSLIAYHPKQCIPNWYRGDLEKDIEYLKVQVALAKCTQ